LNELRNDLAGRVCLITAASRKLGAAIASQMASYGVHVAVNYWESEATARSLCGDLAGLGVRAIAVRADVSRPEDLDHLVAQVTTNLGPIDILVNNAGFFENTPYLRLELSSFDSVMAANLRSVFFLTQIVGRQMKSRGGGHVVNIASTSAYDHCHSVYGLAKSAVIHFTQTVALELAPEVRINAVAPDLIAENEDNPPDLVEKTIASTPLKRLVSRREVADMVCLLCSSVFDFVTGQTIVMDGGRTAFARL
jgi:NAD(P)-dependent dehydrogenase (short-subunit alcohol dehydrogenase family)